MSTSLRYQNAAPNWTSKVQRLGYVQAYRAFLENAVNPSGAVLDVGTGTGAFALSWISAGGSSDITLLDPSSAMLKNARSQFVQHGLQPKVENCRFDEFRSVQKFDAILAAHVLEHFTNPSDAMAQFADRLSSNGRLYLVVSKPHWCNWLIWLRFRHRWFASEQVCDLAQRAGLSPSRINAFAFGPPSRTSLGYIFTKPSH